MPSGTPPLPALLVHWDRLARWFQDTRERPAAHVFQLRFLVAASVLGIAMSVVGAAFAGGDGRMLEMWTSVAYGVGVALLAVPLKLDVRPARLIWPHMIWLAAFCFVDSITSPTLHPEQLAWCLLIPLVVRLLVGAQPVWWRSSWFAAIVVALAVAWGVVACHRWGWTFHQAEATDAASWSALIDFAQLAAAVLGLVWIFDGLRRVAEFELAQLRGLLSVCAWCKKIHTDDGHWQSLEHYVSRRSAATFSHGVCPTCEAKHFPE